MKNTRAIAPMLGILCALLLPVHGNAMLLGQQAPPPGQALSPDQLDGLVAPIALYPDPLLSQILVASTYPLEIVQADRWVQQNPTLQGKALAEAAAKQAGTPLWRRRSFYQEREGHLRIQLPR